MSEIPASITTAAASEFFARVHEGEGEADVIIDVITRAILAERNSKWQPIETAPKGTRGNILLALPSGRVSEGYWGAAKYNRKTNEYDNAWVTGPYSGDVNPTHWQPLPAAPEGK